MRKIFFALLLCLPISLMAQQKIAVINTQAIMAAMPEVRAVQSTIQDLAKKYDADIKSMQDELKTKAEEYAKNKSTMLKTIRERKEQELQDIQTRIQQSYQAMQQDLQKQQQQLLTPIQQKVANAIKKVSDSMGCTYVFESGILLYLGNGALDITKDVENTLGIKPSDQGVTKANKSNQKNK